MRSAVSKRDASSLIFSHVALSDGVIASPETPLYLAPIASAPNSGSDSVQTSNVSTASPLIFFWYSKRNESMIAMDADRSLLGEVTMFKMRIPLPFSILVQLTTREPRTRALQRSEVVQVTSRNIGISAGGHFVECPARAEFEEDARSCFHAAVQAVRPLDRVGDLFGQLVQAG